ncbi:effector-associated constant component EACC1 [Streptomyces phaeochromogenes]|uniref:effector-associated constant component EACC1 n=1 Tax=Streptomyces phaeochromogenes TaxID=1923 RepID=UPI0036A0B752
MELTIQVMADTPQTEARSLSYLMRRDGRLRSTEIRTADSRSSPGEMSGLGDVLLISFGAGGIGIAVVEHALGWLQSRKLTTTLVFRVGGIEVEATVRSVQEATELAQLITTLRTALGEIASDEAS